MDSHALEMFVQFAQAIGDGNLKLADSLLGQILNLAANESDRVKSECVKYFAEALVRRAYGIHPADAFLELTTPSLYCGNNSSVIDVIRDAMQGKKRLHLIDFYIPHFYGSEYLFTSVLDTSVFDRSDLSSVATALLSDSVVSVRVSVVLPPFLEKFVNVEQEKQYLIEQANREGVQLEDLEVVYANSLGEVDDESLLNFRRTEDEAVVVFYLYKLSKLVAEEGTIERELLKLRDLIKPEIVIIQDFDANCNDSNFVKSVDSNFVKSLLEGNREGKRSARRIINNIVGCEGRDRIVRYQTFDHWRSLLLTAGFLPLPLKWKWRCLSSSDLETREDNGGLLFLTKDKESRPFYFVSAWKLTEREAHINNSVQASLTGIKPCPLTEDVVQPLQISPQVVSLNQVAAFAEIYDMLAEVCFKYKVPLALTWACGASMNETMSDPYKQQSLLIQSTCCFEDNWPCRHYIRESEKVWQAIALKALQSRKNFHFRPRIKKLFCYPVDDFGHLWDCKARVSGHAAVAICLQNCYNIDDVYVVEFFLPTYKETDLEKAKSLAHCIFEELKNMPKKFVKVKGVDTEVGFQHETISNIPETMPMRNPPPASCTNDFLQNSNTRDGHVMEIQGLHEQGNGKQTSFESPVNNENETVKTGTKRRKLTSNVWEEYSKKQDAGGKEYAICKYCNRKFDGSSKKGTTHLKNHLDRCKSRVVKVGKSDSKNESTTSFDQARSNMDVARLVIKHQYRLNFVEDEFFNSVLKILQPMFKLRSQKDLSFDIFHVYEEEKHKLLEYFDKLSCRFNLIVSLWRRDLENTTYCCYAVQFIDDSWELKKKILALKCIGNRVQNRILYETFKSFLVDWNFNEKLCSLTVHNSSPCFDIAEEIRNSWQHFKASHPSSTFYLSSDESIHGLLDKDENGEKSIDSVLKTSNACLLDVHNIYHKKLCQQERKDYPLMDVKSENNLSTCSLVLAIAAILDPRFKFYFVEFSYKEIYGHDGAKIHLSMILNTVGDIFNQYASNMGSDTLFFQDGNCLTLLNAEENAIEAFDRWYNSKRNVSSSESELDKYLQEPKISYNEEFDILGWWSKQASKFPILGRMACDILAIPISSILAGSTFNEKVGLDNPVFNGLDQSIIEAMICGKDWLESPKEISNLEHLNKRSGYISCPIVKLEESPALVHHSGLERFSSEYDDEARNEHIGTEATKWTEKDVRAYLISPFTAEETEHLEKWQTHEISGAYFGPDNIHGTALAALLRIPEHDVDSKGVQNYYIKDTIVNKFFDLVKQRYERFPNKYLKHHSFDSFYATFLIDKLKTESQVLDCVKKWVKQEDLNGVSKLFLPMCLNEHWLLFCADFDDKKFLWLDSNEHSRMSNGSRKEIMLHWFSMFLLPWMGYNPNEWSFDVPNDIPSQKNSVDCALFVMKYADCLTHCIKCFPFTQDDMPHFRHRIFIDLYRGSI